MNLNELKIGQSAKILSVNGKGDLRQHFLDMGLIPNAEVTLVKLAPMGDPMELRIHGYELTIRLDDAKNIGIELIDHIKENTNQIKVKNEHPGLGQNGIYHDSKHENELSKDEVLTFALVGNQNCGKTTLFNALTGSNQHVGNFPGVTVDRKDGQIRNIENTNVTDLPGIYSMSPYTNEEIVSRNFVLNEKPKAIINIVDATNIQRNLYLTMQLLEMNVPMVIALNMMDEVSANGGYIDINSLESMLGVPVVPISASKNQGIDELLEHALHVAKYQEKPLKQDFCKDGPVHRCLHAVIHLISDHAVKYNLPVRFAASKLIEGDKLILDQLHLETNEKELLDHIIKQMETEGNLDASAAMANMRYSFIYDICDKTVSLGKENKQHVFSEKLDKVLTGKYTAIPVFVLIMGSIFFLTFNVIGLFLQNLLETGIDNLTVLVDTFLTNAGVNEIIHHLIIEGIFEGVGSVISFLPIIVVLFIFLSLLEDSGYIARVAFVMDKLLRKIGLSGRSIVPLLIGFGCTVPAVMSTRTLSSDRDRKMTILLTPFMSCTAKLPIYAFLVNAFFKQYGGLMMTSLYLFSILIGVIIAYIFKVSVFKGEAVPFVMELPNYRFPTLKNVAQLALEKSKDFIHKAFNIILIATLIIWFLQSFDPQLNYILDSKDSILALIATKIAFVFKPIGLDDWKITTSLISGFIAKESVVSTMEILFSNSVETMITSIQALTLLVFSLLYTPCVAAIAAIKRELGTGYAISVVIAQCIIAYLAAFIIRIIFIGIL